jgi:hypothetical protein
MALKGRNIRSANFTLLRNVSDFQWLGGVMAPGQDGLAEPGGLGLITQPWL